MVRLALVAAAALALAAPSLAAAAPSNGSSGDWTVIGGTKTVSAMARSGDVVYMGGWFTAIARRAGGVAAFDTQTGALASDLADLNPGVARVVAAAPDGGVYVAGPFASVGGVAQARLLRFGPDDKLDRDFRPQVADGDIDDLAVGADGTVYLGGSFTSVGGQTRRGLAAVDGTTGAVRAWAPDMPLNARVRELELSGGNAYVLGDFLTVAGQQRRNLAQISLASGAPTAWAPTPTGSVLALAVAGSTVYLGGSFSALSGEARRRLAAVSASGTGAVLPFNPDPNAAVTKLRAQGTTLYVSGDFTTLGGQARNRVAAFDTGSGTVTSWNPTLSTNDAPTAILPTDQRVYLGFGAPPGRKVSVAGTPRCGLAAVDAASGALDPAWDPQLYDVEARCGGFPDGVRSLALIGDRLWAGGSFQVAGALPRSGLAALDVAADQPLAWAPTTSAPNLSGDAGVRDIALSPDGATVYLGGQFTNLNGVPRLNAAAVGAAGAAADPGSVTGWNPAPNGRVNALALSASGQRVYLGGEFTQVNASGRLRLAWVSPTTGAPSAWAPRPDARVNDLALAADGSVIAAGAFAHAGAQAVQPQRNGIALLSPDSGDATAWDAAAPTATEIDSVAPAGSLLYVAGKLSGAIGGQPRVGVAALDQASAAATAWDAGVSGSSGRIRRVGVAPDGSVYLAGEFTAIGGASRSGLASLDAAGAVSGWNPPGVPSGALPAPPQFAGDRVVAGGAFTNAGGRLQAGFAIFGPAIGPAAGTRPLVRFAAPLRVGSQLTCQPGAFSGSGPFTLAYQWLRDGQEIPGETRLTYTAAPEDSASELSCRERAYNAAGTADQASLGVTVQAEAPASQLPPAVGGEPWVGGRAQCSTGLWRNGPTAYAYRWLLDGAAIPGATAPDHPIADAELGRALACEVTASNDAGAATALSPTVAVGVAPPANVVSPLVAGLARVGEQLRCDPGGWLGASAFAYGWLRDGVTLAGATAPSLTLTSRDLGRRVACRVTATGPGGAREATSVAVLVQALPRQSARRVATRPDAEPGVATRVLDLRRVRLGRDGRLLLTATVPSAGLLRANVQRVGRRAAIGRASLRVRRAGQVSLRLRPSAVARRALRRAGRRGLRLRVTLALTPRGEGRVRRDSATITVRDPRATGRIE